MQKMKSPSALLLLLLIQILCVLSFRTPAKLATDYSTISFRENLSIKLNAATAEVPTSPNSRLRVTISGPSITSALFRAELKKELCFFRGCRASFVTPDNLTGVSELTCEGRTTQISRFLVWLEALSVEVANRKANFQGPSLVAYIDKMAWEDYKVPEPMVKTLNLAIYSVSNEIGRANKILCN
jgi:hypothetical protein